MSTIVIRVAGVDITDDVMLGDAIFVQSVGVAPGEFSFRVKDRLHIHDFIAGNRVTLDIDGTRHFDGYVFQANQKYAFPVVDTTDTSTVARIWTLTGPDINILFQRRFTYDQSDPAAKTRLWPANSQDRDVVLNLISDYLALSGDGITTNGVTHVGSPNPDFEGDIANIGGTWAEAMSLIAELPGAVWGLKPNRDLYYEDVNTETAAFSLSDQPNNTTSFGYTNFAWTDDGTKLVNDAQVWGAGTGSASVVYARTQDATSQATHGVWQRPGDWRYDVYRQTTATAISSSIVYGSPQNLHGGKDDSVNVMLRIFRPGLVAGDKVRIINNTFGLDRVFPIRRMTITFANPTDPIFDLQSSQEIDRPLNYAEFWYPKPKPFPGFKPPVWDRIPTSGGPLDNWNRQLSSINEPGNNSVVPGCASSGFPWNGFFSSSCEVIVDGELHVKPSSSDRLRSSTTTFTIYAPLDPKHLTLTLPLGMSTVGSTYTPPPSGTRQADSTCEFQISISRVGSGLTYGPVGADEITIDVLTTEGKRYDALFAGSVEDLSSGQIQITTPTDNDTTNIAGLFGVNDLLTVTVTDTQATVNLGGYTLTAAFAPTNNPALQAFRLQVDARTSVFNNGNVLDLGQEEITVGDITAESDLPCPVEEVMTCVPLATGVGSVEPGAYGCETPTQISVSTFETTYAFTPGTSMVYLNGTLQRRGLDYYESSSNPKRFFFGEAVAEEDDVWVCYLALGTSSGGGGPNLLT